MLAGNETPYSDIPVLEYCFVRCNTSQFPSAFLSNHTLEPKGRIEKSSFINSLVLDILAGRKRPILQKEL